MPSESKLLKIVLLSLCLGQTVADSDANVNPDHQGAKEPKKWNLEMKEEHVGILLGEQHEITIYAQPDEAKKRSGESLSLKVSFAPDSVGVIKALPTRNVSTFGTSSFSFDIVGTRAGSQKRVYKLRLSLSGLCLAVSGLKQLVVALCKRARLSGKAVLAPFSICTYNPQQVVVANINFHYRCRKPSCECFKS